MRSVIVLFRGANKPDIEAALDLCCTENQRNPWIISTNHDPILYLDVDDDFSDLYLDDVALSNGESPYYHTFSHQLVIDISGRYAGDSEVMSVLRFFFDRFDVVVCDDYTDHLWTKQEIFNGDLIQNHKFFDYNGW